MATPLYAPSSDYGPDHYEQTIIRTGKGLDRSKLGGFTKDQILESPFSFIMHLTDVSNLEAILEDGKLSHRWALGREGKSALSHISGNFPERQLTISTQDLRQFPGVYTHLESVKDVASKTFFPWATTQIGMVFSLALLQQRNWHLNARDNFGTISGLTFDAATLPLQTHQILGFYGKDETLEYGVVQNELVFHDPLPIYFLQEIITTTDETTDLVDRLLTKYNLDEEVPIYSKNIAASIIRKRIKGLDDYQRLSDRDPQLCYFPSQANVGEDTLSSQIDPYSVTDRIDPPKERGYVKSQLLRNCQLSLKEVVKPEDVLARETEARLDGIYFGEEPRFPVAAHPPFALTKGYYDKLRARAQADSQ